MERKQRVCHTEGRASAQTRRMEDNMVHWLTGAESQMAMWMGEGSRISQARIMVACTISAQGLAQNKKAFHISYFILLS